jgi:hypothetical protein
MSTTSVNKQNPVKRVQTKGKMAAKEVAYSPNMERLVRLGYAVKGFIYVAMGFIAFRGALGKSRTPADQLGAISEFSKLPYADILLWIILIGLISYSLWGLIRAILDPLHKGTDTEGLLARAGYLISAATYASFVVPTYNLIKHARSAAGQNQTAQMVSKIMAMPLGRLLVGGIGVAAIGAGLYQIYLGITLNFEQQFRPYDLSPEQYKVAKLIGRFGTAARGVVFALVGFFFCLAAYYSNPSQAQGISGALSFLAKQPYGLWLLGIMASGLIAFGIYSLMSAVWFRLKR